MSRSNASTDTFIPFDHVSSTFERVLANSPADETELVWFERKYGEVSSTKRSDVLESPRLTVLIRVIEGGRQGWHRTDSTTASELEAGLRQALAVAKVQPKAKKRPVLPTNNRDLRFSSQLLDREISQLDLRSARNLLAEWCPRGVKGRIDWSETRLAVFNSHGLRRSAASSELTFEALSNGGVGTGRAAGSARSLKALDAPKICQRACLRPAEKAAELPEQSVPVMLSPEATIALLNVINTFALAGRSYLDGTSFLVRHRNFQVFDRALNLRDDGHRVPGVPFPFDLEGSPKQPLDLICKGQPSAVALNHYQGAEAGMEPTAQAVGGQDSLFGNLFLLPGEASESELLEAAEGGIYVGWLEPPECYEPTQLRVRMTARCVRKIEGGQFGAALPDFVWEESLLRALARLNAIGREAVVHATSTTPLGAISAPAIVLADTEGFCGPAPGLSGAEAE
ncbi:MAG: metallopeptidase TldD-related protein [Acidobacteriota bacterium]